MLRWIATICSFVGAIALVPFVFILFTFIFLEPVDREGLSTMWLAGPAVFLVGQIIHLLIAIWEKCDSIESP